MNTKMLLASLAGGVAAFLLGWLIFGTLMAGYFETQMVQYEGLMRGPEDMNLGLMFLSNLLFASALAYIFTRAGVHTALGGLATGAIVGALIYASVDLSFASMMNLFIGSTSIVVDILANTVWAALIGAVVGFMLGQGKASAA
jgi:hypothetical protein